MWFCCPWKTFAQCLRGLIVITRRKVVHGMTPMIHEMPLWYMGWLRIHGMTPWCIGWPCDARDDLCDAWDDCCDIRDDCCLGPSTTSNYQIPEVITSLAENCEHNSGAQVWHCYLIATEWGRTSFSMHELQKSVRRQLDKRLLPTVLLFTTGR